MKGFGAIVPENHELRNLVGLTFYVELKMTLEKASLHQNVGTTRVAAYIRNLIGERIDGNDIKVIQTEDREACLPCVAITGVVKAMRYEVGMPDDEIKRFHGEWVAVYVAKGWRLIVPLWAFSAVAGFTQGNWIEMERDGEAVFEPEGSFAGVEITQLNDYYFLTDPDHLIFDCFPEEEQ
ncbi:hypothetical protein CHS0354_037923 [Potamilus streckersoni]|uniref:Uncharacterized protein n=1 Tax=Potamilus streckersoni TaxID=2493646 RepID=A0AAE0T9I9_9BIVA|nr:hypothetical protein CHS0354_037923 [Potamilus streckersoni]